MTSENIERFEWNLIKSQTRYTKAEKIKRLCWMSAWMLVKYIPGKGSALRIAVLRFFGAQIGRQCLISAGVDVLMPWNLRLDDLVTIGQHTNIYNHSEVHCGKSSVISQYCYICTSSHDFNKVNFPLIHSPIQIGSNCWIAAGCWILSGVEIGDYSIVGARSLVTKNLPSNQICAGHPCMPKRPRFSK